jgi:hypothetical protein
VRTGKLRRAGGGLAAVLLVAGVALADDQPAERAGRIGSILGAPEQVAKDRMAVRLLASAPVQKAIADLEVLYQKDPTSALPDAKATLHRAAEATAMANIVGVLNHDPDRPYAYWSITAPHSWGDVHVPLAGLMIDDTDNVYRSIPVDGAASYVIHGQVIGAAPTQETFILHNETSGAKKGQAVRTQEAENGAVSLDKLAPGPDGKFTITIDNSPTAGRANHIQSDPDVHDGYVLIRDTLGDWAHQNPVKLDVERVAGPPMRPALTEAQMAQKAADLTETAGPYWLAWAHARFFDHEANTYSFNMTRVSGWGFNKCGYYVLKDDEALVVRLDPSQAAYLGFQLSDVWGQGQAPSFIDRLGSLNARQARPDADGLYTYVISIVDPGVHNWLDTAGLHAGTFCTRWQKLPPGVNTETAVREMKVVKLADLKAALPAGTAWVTPAERRAQVAEHGADYDRRLRN